MKSEKNQKWGGANKTQAITKQKAARCTKKNEGIRTQG